MNYIKKIKKGGGGTALIRNRPRPRFSDASVESLAEQIHRDLVECRSIIRSNLFQQYSHTHPEYYDRVVNMYESINNRWYRLLTNNQELNNDSVVPFIHAFNDLKSFMRQHEEFLRRRPIHATDIDIIHIPETTAVRQPSTTSNEAIPSAHELNYVPTAYAYPDPEWNI